MLHCYTGGRDLARRAIALGLFISFTGILTFNPGEQTKTITVQTLTDEIEESDETFLVQLSGAVGAAITRGTGTGTISEVAVVGLSGFVYVDSNGDGLKGPGEVGIPGATVELFGTAVLTTVAYHGATVLVLRALGWDFPGLMRFVNVLVPTIFLNALLMPFAATFARRLDLALSSWRRLELE